jgi:integrase/recombinase XerD
LWRVTEQLRKRIIAIIESDSLTDESEREKLLLLITTKKWNPYCFRHSSITWDAERYNEFSLRKKVRWSMNSVQPARYIKNRWGNDLKKKILLENGIITEEESRPVAVNAECARCKFVNSSENKYCSACAYPLSVTAYEELKEEETKEIDALKIEVAKLSESVAAQEKHFRRFLDVNLQDLMRILVSGNTKNIQRAKNQLIANVAFRTAKERLYDKNGDLRTETDLEDGKNRSD